MKTLVYLLALWAPAMHAQCNQHVFSSVGATEWTNFVYQDCDSIMHYFGLPADSLQGAPQSGYTAIFCADIGTAFVLNGDGFVYPLLTEHPNFPSCVEPEVLPCIYDFDGDGIVDTSDLLTFLSNYGVACAD